MNPIARRFPHRRQQAMALIAVLWLVAALSIMVTGIVRSMRTEARLVGDARQISVEGALGDAAIQLALQQLAVRTTPLVGIETASIPYHGVDIAVQVQPLNGLIDLNRAPPELLAATLRIAAGLPPAQADQGAQAIVDWRQTRDAHGGSQVFEATEDLLRVPGFAYDLYARMAPLLTADQPGSGRVNPMAAPESVLAVLANGDIAQAARIAAQRAAGAAGVDTSALNGAWLDASATRRLRLTALVPLPDGAVVQVSRSVDLTASARDGMPWTTFRFQQHLQPDAPPR